MDNFPVVPQFNRAQFIGDIERAIELPFNNSSDDAYLRERGIRYVIEAPIGMSLEDVRLLVREFLYSEFTVEPLFPDYSDSIPKENLKDFYLAFISGVSFSALSQSPYNAAYELLARTPLLSVEPDKPYLQFITTSSNVSAVSAPTDKAWSLRNMRVDSAWNIPPPSKGLKNGKGVSIAHLDTGWTDHQDLDQINFDYSRVLDLINPKNNAQDPLNYSGNPGHGTKTGSVIMSQGGVNNLSTTGPGQITGVAREVTYVPIRCIKSVVTIFNSDVARAIAHATNKAKCDLISMSLGGPPMKALHVALKNATSKDLIAVCAAGNNVRTVVWPARYPEAIAVAASNCFDKPWSSSSRGKRVDISAPGEDVWKAEPDTKNSKVSPGSGTSYSTANLAGVAALWIAFYEKSKLETVAHNSNSNLQELFRSSIKSTARKVSGWDNSKYGPGIVQAYNLLKATPQLVSNSDSNNQVMNNYSCVNNDDLFSRLVLKVCEFSILNSKTGTLDFFENELSHIILDFLDDAESHIGLYKDLVSDVLYKIKNQGSKALLSVLNMGE